MKTSTLWKLAAAGAAAFWIPQGLQWLRGMNRLPNVRPDTNPSQDYNNYDARLAIIVPACNEGKTVRAAMSSILEHAPQASTIFAVDDRSTDDTGEALDDLAVEDGRLHVVHLTELPHGWLGKTHAIQCGVFAAEELWGGAEPRDYLLFTDADVVYARNGIATALRYARENDLDHLTLFPGLDVRGFWETVFVSAFTFLFGIRFRIWDVNNPQSSAYVGIGAFNMVRAEAYNRMGGHRRLALDVGDDVRLGQEIRKSGGRQMVVVGTEICQVRWQRGLWGLITGLEKNGFAGLEYSVPHLVGSTIGMILLASPFVGVWLTRGRWRALNAGSLLLIYQMYALGRKQGGASGTYFVTYPLGTALFLVTIWRSAYLALRRGGIQWRNTFYPLEELRAFQAGRSDRTSK